MEPVGSGGEIQEKGKSFGRQGMGDGEMEEQDNQENRGTHNRLDKVPPIIPSSLEDRLYDNNEGSDLVLFFSILFLFSLFSS